MNGTVHFDFSFVTNQIKKAVKKTIWIFGSILGTILTVNMIYQISLFYTNPDMKRHDIIGYAAMVVVFSLIFFGIRNYRNKELHGYISFGKAFKTGALMALLASTIYVVVGLYYYYQYAPDFLDKYIPYVLKQTPQADLPEKTREMEQYREMYKNPVFVVLLTYSEVLPVGLVVALISALILKKKKKDNSIPVTA